MNWNRNLCKGNINKFQVKKANVSYDKFRNIMVMDRLWFFEKGVLLSGSIFKSREIYQ